MVRIISALSTAALLFALAASFSCSASSPYSVGTPDSLFSEFVLAWDLANANHSSFLTNPDTDWDEVFSRWRVQALMLSDHDELLAVITGMLAELENGQVLLRTPQGLTRPYDPGFFENFDAVVWQSYTDQWGFQYYTEYFDFGWAFVTPDSTMGYLFLPDMGDMYNWAEFLYMTVSVRDCAGIILDLRPCGGTGDFMSAYSTAGRFVSDGNRLAFYRQFRTGPGRYDMEEPSPVIVSKQGSWQFDVPIVVLVGRGTAGTAELLTLMLRTQDNVTIMGDNTFGAPDVGNPHLLNDMSHLEETWLYLPGFVVYDNEMNVLNLVGVEPGIAVPVSPDDFAAGVDPVLDAAVDYLTLQTGAQ
ncbi:MAG: S41 family peptidase [Candidatus Fermentibacteraceae bacterium]